MVLALNLNSSKSYYLQIQMTLKSNHSQTRFGKRTTCPGNCSSDGNGNVDNDDDNCNDNDNDDYDYGGDDGFFNLNPKNISNLWPLITPMPVHQLSYHLMTRIMLMA